MSDCGSLAYIEWAMGERRDRLTRLLAQIEWRRVLAERLHWDGRQ